MSNTFTAPFPQTPKTATTVVTGACVIGSADAPTNVVELMTAGADGAILTNLSAMARATNTASSLLLFLSNDNGATKRLIDSEVMTAQTINATTEIKETQFNRYSEITPLRLGANDKLYAASAVALAAGIVFKAEYTNF